MSKKENPLEGITEEKDESPTGDVKYIKIENTTYEVVSNYVGKNSLLDIVKSAIRRDVESGNY
jgi:hypothetical protein